VAPRGPKSWHRLGVMGEIKGIIHIKDGQVNWLQNVSDRNAALLHEGNLAIVLSELFHTGWKLQGDYTLT